MATDISIRLKKKRITVRGTVVDLGCSTATDECCTQWDCINGYCQPSPGGPYASYEECQAATCNPSGSASGSASGSGTGEGQGCEGPYCDTYLVRNLSGTLLATLVRSCIPNHAARWVGGGYLLSGYEDGSGDFWVLFQPPPPNHVCVWGMSNWGGNGCQTFSAGSVGGNPPCANVQVCCG